VNDVNKARVRSKIDEDPKKSTRRLSLELEISHSSVFRILKAIDLKPYRGTLVHLLKPEDPELRCFFLNLRDAIVASFSEVLLDMCKNVFLSVEGRLKLCLESNGFQIT
jgi:hypothetical protein